MTFYDLNMNSKRITSCQDPSGNQDVATKNYADRNLTINTQTASYTLVASDRNKRVIMDSSSNTIITVDSGIFTEGDTVFIANKGTGTTTVAEGSGVTVGTSSGKELVQYRSGLLLSFSSTLFSFFPSAGPLPVFIIEYLVIAGGGGGGSGIADRSNGGAGGAGGYRCSVTGETTGGGGSAETPITVNYNQLYTITVGNGGASDAPGQNSSIVSISTSVISTGGGFGAGTNLGNGGDGGSSGGGSGGAAPPPPNPSAPGTRTASPIQGFNGGSGEGANPFRGGGGGGSGEAGNTDGQGDGGDGIFSSITGANVQRGGGGSGGTSGTLATPGAGGGGQGSGTGVGGAGVANTGGGGGGGYNLGSAAGGAGGKGIVILRTPSSAPTATTLTVGTYDGSVSGYKIYTFLSSGTIAWS